MKESSILESKAKILLNQIKENEEFTLDEVMNLLDVDWEEAVSVLKYLTDQKLIKLNYTWISKKQIK